MRLGPFGRGGGWQCGRCSAKNDDSAMACTSCGLIRGGVVPTQAPPAALPPNTLAIDAGPAPASPEPAGTPTATSAPSVPARRRGIVSILSSRLVIVVIFIVVAGVIGWYSNAGRSSTGEITKSGNLTVSDLRVGDCFDLKDTQATLVSDVTARPCSQEHQYELFYAGSMPAGDYPDEATFSSYVDTNCGVAFGTYVGKAYVDSALDVDYFFPSNEVWNNGDRAIQCALYDPHNSRLTGSLKGAAR